MKIDRDANSGSQAVAVFIDRDGTLNDDKGYIASPDQLTLFPGVGQAVSQLNQAGMPAVLVTNQSGLARGLFSWDDLEKIHLRLCEGLHADGGVLDGLYVCPHHPDDNCHCRKPRRGLIDQASRDLGLEPRCSYVVGDKSIDMELAYNIGAVGVLVLTGPESQKARQWVTDNQMRVGFVAENFVEAVNWILTDVSVRS